MNGTNGKQSDFPDVALVPYPVIVAATKGDPDAMKIVFFDEILHHSPELFIGGHILR